MAGSEDMRPRTYAAFHAESLADPEAFWGREAARIDWHKPWTRVLDATNLPFRSWFVGGETNLCHNAVDRHVATRGEQPALVWISTEVDAQRVFTYRQLRDEVTACAAVLRAQGVG